MMYLDVHFLEEMLVTIRAVWVATKDPPTPRRHTVFTVSFFDEVEARTTSGDLAEA
jgi:hypothetical protein